MNTSPHLVVIQHSSNLGTIVIRDGIIESITSNSHLAPVVNEPDVEIDATNMIIWPGAVDGHVHFRYPGNPEKEDWTSGTIAALYGGTTSVVDMPNTNPPVLTANDVADKHEHISQLSSLDVVLPITGTDEGIQQLIGQALLLSPKQRVIKVFMGASTGHLAIAERTHLERLFKEVDALFLLHAEDQEIISHNERSFSHESSPAVHSAIRNRAAAIAALEEAIELAERYNRRIHICHVSTAEEVQLIAEAKARGTLITSEATPHHLLFTSEHYAQLGNKLKVNPPIREQADIDALWFGLQNGVIDIVATDHAPHTLAEKQADYWHAPAGLPGVEFRVPLILTAVAEGKITLDQAKHILVDHPAKLFGFDKHIAVGKPADLTVIDPAEEWVIQKHHVQTKVGWSPYEGYRCIGRVRATIKHQQAVFA